MIGGCSVHLDGVNDYVDLGVVAGRNFTTQTFSGMAWIYPRAFGGVRLVLCHGVLGASGYDFRIGATGNLRLRTTTAAVNYFTDTAAGVITLDQWQHLAWSMNAGVVSLYLNGNLLPLSATLVHPAPTGSAGNSAVGATVGGGGNWLYGAIDEPAFFNVALTQQQIRNYMYGGMSALTPGLVSYHKFDDGLANFASTTAVATVSGVNGTLTNGATWVLDRWAPWIEPRISATGNLAVASDVAAVVPGMLRNYIPRVASRLLILVQMDFVLTTAGTGSIIGEVRANGVAINPPQAIVTEPAAAVLSRGQHSLVVLTDLAASTFYAIDFVGHLLAAANTIRGTINSLNTGMAIVAAPVDGTF